MSKFAVIGLGRFGWKVATTLSSNGVDVIAIEKDQKLIDEIKDHVAFAAQMDATDETALRGVGINEADAVVLAIGSSIQESILCCAILKKLGVSVIHAKAENHLHSRILEFLGVTSIYLPEEMIGEQLAKTLISKNILEYINLTSGHIMVELVTPAKYVGKTLQEIDLTSERGINIVAIKYNYLSIGEDGSNIVEVRVNDMPGANDILHEGDIMILLGTKGNIDKLIRDTAEKKV